MSDYPYPKNFSRNEFLRSATATRNNISNQPSSPAHEENLSRLAYWLQRVRDRMSAHYKRDVIITVTSGYRSHALNTFVRGSKSSAHCHGHAADIYCSGLSVRDVCKFIAKHCADMPFDQVIDEYGEWTHIGLIRPSTGEIRGQFLQARRNTAGKTYYAPIDYLK